MALGLNARGAQENLWPKSSLERPVARHFVCFCISTWRAVCKPLKTQARLREAFVGIALKRKDLLRRVEEQQRMGRTRLWKRSDA